jgi:hypothetical protein
MMARFIRSPRFILELVYVTLLESDPDVLGANETTLNALSEIESGGGEVFESVDELFKDLDN